MLEQKISVNISTFVIIMIFLPVVSSVQPWVENLIVCFYFSWFSVFPIASNNNIVLFLTHSFKRIKVLILLTTLPSSTVSVLTLHADRMPPTYIFTLSLYQSTLEQHIEPQNFFACSLLKHVYISPLRKYRFMST